LGADAAGAEEDGADDPAAGAAPGAALAGLEDPKMADTMLPKMLIARSFDCLRI
jgi:hypothetical protein